jgi:hypothetical protein
MRIAAGRVEQQRVADVIQGRAVLGRRQRAACGTGKILKTHALSFRKILPRDAVAPSRNTAHEIGFVPNGGQKLQVLEKLSE